MATKSKKMETSQERPIEESSERSTATWLKAIIEAVGDGDVTVDEIADRVGTIIQSPESPPIADYVESLLEEGVLQHSGQEGHVELAESGKFILEGVLAERASKGTLTAPS